jgi:hypothetical protein
MTRSPKAKIAACLRKSRRRPRRHSGELAIASIARKNSWASGGRWGAMSATTVAGASQEWLFRGCPHRPPLPHPRPLPGLAEPSRESSRTILVGATAANRSNFFSASRRGLGVSHSGLSQYHHTRSFSSHVIQPKISDPKSTSIPQSRYRFPPSRSAAIEISLFS